MNRQVFAELLQADNRGSRSRKSIPHYYPRLLLNHQHQNPAQHFRPVGSRKCQLAPNRQQRGSQSIWRNRLTRKAKLYSRMTKNQKKFR